MKSKCEMKGLTKKWLSQRRFLIVIFAISILLPSIALSDVTYKFERMWPTLQQPWYFHCPNNIATDYDGNVYVIGGDNLIKVFNSNGQFIRMWENQGGQEDNLLNRVFISPYRDPIPPYSPFS